MIIAIDGLGVNGKSTLARMLANKLNIKNFNTGSIYRCMALDIINNNLDVHNIEEVIKHLKLINIDFDSERVFLEGVDVTNQIRTENISVKATEWATIPEIKELVRKIQKEFINQNDVVIEGRDICTRIAPNAEFKFYLYSDFETRVARLYNSNKSESIDTIRKNLIIRDKIDIEGDNFVKPNDAIEIDTTDLSINDVYNIMLEKINSK
jgi:cytidylate kinase